MPHMQGTHAIGYNYLDVDPPSAIHKAFLYGHEERAKVRHLWMPHVLTPQDVLYIDMVSLQEGNQLRI